MPFTTVTNLKILIMRLQQRRQIFLYAYCFIFCIPLMNFFFYNIVVQCICFQVIKQFFCRHRFCENSILKSRMNLKFTYSILQYSIFPGKNIFFSINNVSNGRYTFSLFAFTFSITVVANTYKI
jgi:hypothetical protein